MLASSTLLIRILRSVLLLAWCGLLLTALLMWLIPIEVFQSWAVDRAHQDDFSRFEAFGGATIATWFVRWLASGMALVLFGVWTRRDAVAPVLAVVAKEFWTAAAPRADRPVRMATESGNVSVRTSAERTEGSGVWSRIQTAIPRLIVLGWFVLAVAHFWTSAQRRMWDWPVYRFKPGREILPNISDTNREVIRYLEAATPPGARILVLSDQKLFFLSYYLLPRRLYHPTHPDSEFVIAQPFNQRQLAAYRLHEIDPERVRNLRPDFILNYFEGEKYISGQDLKQDRNWLAFQARRFGPDWRPQILVDLRPYSPGATP